MHKFARFLIEIFEVPYIERGLSRFRDKFFAFSPCSFIHITSSAVKYSKLYLAKAKLYMQPIGVSNTCFLFFLISRYFPLSTLNLTKQIRAVV